MKKFILSIQANNKWTFFALILLAIGIIGTVISLIAHFTFLKDNIETRPRIAIVAPLNSEMGNNFRHGAKLYIDTVNFKGGHNGRMIEFFEVDESPEAAAKVMEDNRVIGVVGYLDSEILKQSASVYEQNHIPVVTPLFLPAPITGVTSIGIDPKDQARFVANYARNIQQQRMMYIVREEGAEFDALVEPFVEVYQRFDIPVKQVWTIPKGENRESQLKKTLEEIKNIDIGGVYIAASSDLSAQLIKGIRDSGNALELYGSSQLASNAFAADATALAKKDGATLTHGIIASTPVLFDTANEKAQNFQRYYQEEFGQSPDWMATYAYDATKIVLSLKPGEDEVQGILGELNFVGHQAQIPIQMGIYSGDRLISAPVQLLPIAKGANFNYIEALRQGRVLYVNDRFMFKTNVVYVGVKINEVSDLDFQKEIATIDMTIWFRYRGNFSPQDLHITNSVEPVVLDKAEESKDSEDVQYRRYRIKQKFKFNFTNAKRAYGQHIAGISFRHRQLNRNNVTYVVDVLGMPTGHALIEDLHKRKVLKSNTGWAVDNAWESQDLVNENGDGAPQYVGMTGEKPLFSKITMGMLIKPTASARDIIPGEYFIYIGIFGVLGAIFAVLMDVRNWGKFSAMQSWILRLLFWPLALLAFGNLTLDWAFIKLSPSTTLVFVVTYESLWWILGAILVDIGVRRFIWEPLAQYSSSRVPNVIKLFVTILIFAFAFSGILVFVFNQSPTSLLATSGVLAMVVGMAVKDIIANVFSGIILNFERPFKVGDKIKINTVTGIVKDITWRTTRVESTEGHMVSLANGKVTEAFMENYSQTPNGVADEIHFYTAPGADPISVITIIHEALEIFCRDMPNQDPSIKYKGVINVAGDWVSDFHATYRLESSGKKGAVRENLWIYLHQKFLEHDISLLPISEKLAANNL
jgi:potassium efflux system protein